MSQFNAQSTAADVIQGISLAGRTALVTGASSGLGIETSRALASSGARVLMAARDPVKLQEALDTVLTAQPNARLEAVHLDLADLGSVRAAAQSVLAAHDELHLLVNNAGVMACPLQRTVQGFEMQFGTNHVGHFLFTCLLVPALLAGAPARVVNLSSAGHKMAAFNPDDPNYEQREYDKWQAYGESKTANVLFSVGLEQRLGERGVHALAVHPGAIMTNLSRHMQPEDLESMMAKLPAGQALEFKTLEQGSATSVWAASSPELEGRGALYLEDCHIAAPAVAGEDGGVESYALDPATADRLWALSEQLVGETFDF
jgi:NAD(P)-dependent dehydrogenase (short-subunit alcohol dehydrogenase family)